MKFFVPLSKVEDAADGTVRVVGIASTEATDSDGEIIKASAMDAALPDYFRHGTGALREMHQPIAAGTVDEADVGKNGHTTIMATVVDPIAILKVRTGVYKGFSIGGRVTGRDPDDRNIITGIRLSEISLVDRPANAEAVMSIYKLENAEADESETDPEKKQLAVIEPTVGELTVNKVSTGTIEVEPVETPAVETVAEAEAGEPVQCWHCGIGEHTHVAKAEARACIGAQALAKRNKPVEDALDALAKAEAAAGIETPAVVETEVKPEPEVEAEPVLISPQLDFFAMAERLGELAKAGARNSTADQALIQTMHDHSVALGAGCAPDDDEVAEAGKAQRADDLAKVTTERDGLIAQFAAIGPRLEELTKRLAVVEAQPATPKYMLRAVDKTEDGTTADPETTEAAYLARLDTMTPDQRTNELMKLALRMPTRISG